YERKAGETQAHADEPALAGRAQVEEGREKRRRREADEPEGRVHPENPSADRHGPPHRVRVRGRLATDRLVSSSAEATGGVDDRKKQRDRGDRPGKEAGARGESVGCPEARP